MIRHVSFDFDGVIAQGSNQAYLDIYHQALLTVGVEHDPYTEKRLILDSWGQPVEQQIELLLQDHPDKVADAVAVFTTERRSPEFRARVSLFPGALDTIKLLCQRYSLSIVSGAEKSLIQSVLGPELEKCFTSIHSCSEYEPALQKPSPHMLFAALSHSQVAPHEAVYVGDAPNDMRMALAAQAEPIAILTGHLTRSTAAELGVKFIIEDISELPDLVAHLHQPGVLAD